MNFLENRDPHLGEQGSHPCDALGQGRLAVSEPAGSCNEIELPELPLAAQKIVFFSKHTHVINMLVNDLFVRSILSMRGSQEPSSSTEIHGRGTYY